MKHNRTRLLVGIAAILIATYGIATYGCVRDPSWNGGIELRDVAREMMMLLALVAGATALVGFNESRKAARLAQKRAESATENLKTEIFQRKQAEVELSNREAKLTAILNSTIDPLITVDARGVIQDASQSVETTFGWTPTELIGRNLNHLMPEPYRSAHDAYIARHIAGGECRVLGKLREFTAVRKDGSLFPCEVRAWRVDVPEQMEPLFTGFIRDLTERRQRENELAGLNDKLIAAARRTGMAAIANSVLHNVGNVLNSVNVSTSLIAERLRSSALVDLKRAITIMESRLPDLGTFITEDERGKHLPRFLIDLTRQMADDEQAVLNEAALLAKNVEHIKDIIALQQSATGLSGLITESSLAELCEDAIRINTASVTRHHIELVREFEDLPDVAIDKQKVLQILVNLISNAKYAVMESENAEKRIVVRLRKTDDDRVCIEVEDNGIGIPKTMLDRLFSYGFTTRKEGHGFGLHSAALAAEEMDATLCVRSDGPGKGATFSLKVPLTRVAEAAQLPKVPNAFKLSYD